MLKALVMLLSLSALVANAQPPDRSHLKALSVPELKAAYLECDQLASTPLLDSDTAASCSMVSEELIERGFDGSFQRLLAWWHSARNTSKQ